MKKQQGWDNEKPSRGFEQLKAGAYLCVITHVEDVQDKEYLKIEIDIDGGPLLSYFNKQFVSWGNWPSAGTMYKSYKKSALGIFKAFIEDVEKSNAGFTWKWDENKLVGKSLGVIFREEEYLPQRGRYINQVRTTVKPYQTCAVSDIDKQKVPPKKELPELRKPKEKNDAVDTNDFLSGDESLEF